MHIAHVMIGLFVTIVMVVTCFQVYSYDGWKQGAGAHAILGLIAYIISIFVGVSGIISAAMQQWYKGDKPWAEREKVYRVNQVHRYSSYFMLLLGNGVCSGGIATYFSKIGFGWYGNFGVCTSGFFLIMIGLHEYFMRRNNRLNYNLIDGD